MLNPLLESNSCLQEFTFLERERIAHIKHYPITFYKFLFAADGLTLYLTGASSILVKLRVDSIKVCSRSSNLTLDETTRVVINREGNKLLDVTPMGDFTNNSK
jgi:hypothetical protein